ncbi:hypothetical protein [uncultured Methylobacterium sp.]|uniref:hypothetical protein n=1 Tax=uncultured Methylobacterium sp. TaxID=157278 RepID=UPI0025898F44|nr:hypothetical protein [uncultured Methylobacterium sp.]
MFNLDATSITVLSGPDTHLGFTVAELRRAAVPEVDIRAGVVAHLAAAIDEQAEQLRTRFITPGAGQALEYQEAQTQAAAALKGAASAATAEKYPMLAASIGVDIDPETGAPATDIVGVARGVQAARDAWLAIGAAIRGVRLKGKAAIATAATVEEAVAAYDAIGWPPLPG